MKLILGSLPLVAVVLVACGGDDGYGDDVAVTPDVTRDVRTPAGAATSPGDRATPAAGDEVEVQGIVGAVDEAARTIQINRLQGADVDVIEVRARTRITRASGATLQLGDLRPSDRIVARGTVEDGALVATKIEVGPVVPGAPGG